MAKGEFVWEQASLLVSRPPVSDAGYVLDEMKGKGVENLTPLVRQ